MNTGKRIQELDWSELSFDYQHLVPPPPRLSYSCFLHSLYTCWFLLLLHFPS